MVGKCVFPRFFLLVFLCLFFITNKNTGTRIYTIFSFLCHSLNLQTMCFIFVCSNFRTSRVNFMYIPFFTLFYSLIHALREFAGSKHGGEFLCCGTRIPFLSSRFYCIHTRILNFNTYNWVCVTFYGRSSLFIRIHMFVGTYIHTHTITLAFLFVFYNCVCVFLHSNLLAYVDVCLLNLQQKRKKKLKLT